MNKQERKLKGQYKFKKRIRKGLHVSNLNKYRTTSTPCSCFVCSPGKIEEKAKYRLNKFKK